MLPHLGTVVRRCRGVAVRWWPATRVGLASYWTATLAWAVMTALHLRWLAQPRAIPGEVLSGYGAGLVLLGVWIGARPYMRAGVSRMIDANLPRYRGMFPRDRGAAGRHRARVAAMRPGVRLDVLAERVVAVAVVLLGTFLNGYGAPLARRWHLHG